MDNNESSELDEMLLFAKASSQHFNDCSPEEKILRSKSFQDALRLRQDWSPIKKLQLGENNGNYSKYSNIYAQIKDKAKQDNLSFNEKNESLGKNIHKFAKRMDPTIEEKINFFEDISDGEPLPITKEHVFDDDIYSKLIPASNNTSKRPKNAPFFADADGKKIKLKEEDKLEKTARVKTLPDRQNVMERNPFLLDEYHKLSPEQKVLYHYQGGNEDIINESLKELDIVQKQRNSVSDHLLKERKERNLKNFTRRVLSTNISKRFFMDKKASEDALKRNEEKENDLYEEEEKEEKEEELLQGGAKLSEIEKEEIPTVKAMNDDLDDEMDKEFLETDDTNRQIQWNMLDQDRNDFKVPHYIHGRVSPWAKEEIYQLYMRGWSVRDISHRFGLLPERIKVIIWCKKTFYDEVMPNINITTVRLGIEREIIYNTQYPFIDFGLDLERLVERERGLIINHFTPYGKHVDFRALDLQDKRYQTIMNSKQKKRYDIVTEKFIGKAGSGYFIKNWVIHRGHGSERVNRAFKRAVYDSERPHKFSNDIARKYKRGPRYAGQGHGIK